MDIRDVLRDPQFSERPQHPDFWRLSEQVLKQDARHEGPGDFQHDNSVIDLESLVYLSAHRARRFAADLHLSEQATMAVMAALMTGIVHGIEFEKAGGHRDG